MRVPVAVRPGARPLPDMLVLDCATLGDLFSGYAALDIDGTTYLFGDFHSVSLPELAATGCPCGRPRCEMARVSAAVTARRPQWRDALLERPASAAACGLSAATREGRGVFSGAVVQVTPSTVWMALYWSGDRRTSLFTYSHPQPDSLLIEDGLCGRCRSRWCGHTALLAGMLFSGTIEDDFLALIGAGTFSPDHPVVPDLYLHMPVDGSLKVEWSGATAYHLARMDGFTCTTCTGACVHSRLARALRRR